MITDVVQRHDHGEVRWRSAREVVDVRTLDVAEMFDDATPKRFVVTHHYAGTYVAAVRRFGLYQHGELVGVCVFDQPVNDACLSCLPCGGRDGAHLARLVLLDAVGANAESRFVGRVFELLAREGYSGAVSFSDPLERRTVDGKVITPGHVGVIYQALDGAFLGRTRAERRLLLPDGTVVHNRALAKIRHGECGWRYCTARLVAHGAAPIEEGADARAWLARELPRITRSVRHPGNYKYAWTFQRRDREHLARYAIARGLVGPWPRFELPRYPKFHAPGAIARAA